MTITFYDIPSTKGPWSPNTLKTRIALNYKGVPYETKWVEYPDIEPTLKEMGAAPTSKKSNGQDYYTLPAIHDSVTGKTITDSANIAAYLDDQYPDKPTLFPKDANAAIALPESTFMETVVTHIRPFMLPETCFILNPPSEEYYRRTREADFGMKMEEIAPPGSSKRAESWVGAKEGLTKFANLYDRNGKGKLFFLGDEFSHADAVVVAWLVWMQIVLGAGSEEWKVVADLNDGRWGRLLEATKREQVIPV